MDYQAIPSPAPVPDVTAATVNAINSTIRDFNRAVDDIVREVNLRLQAIANASR